MVHNTRVLCLDVNRCCACTVGYLLEMSSEPVIRSIVSIINFSLSAIMASAPLFSAPVRFCMAFERTSDERHMRTISEWFEFAARSSHWAESYMFPGPDGVYLAASTHQSRNRMADNMQLRT